MFKHTMQFALILQIEASILGQYTDLLACAFMKTTPWCAECRQCRTFLRCVLGITILRYNNTRPLSVLRWCLTSQYSRTKGAVRLRVLGKPCCITLISFSYWGPNQTPSILHGPSFQMKGPGRAQPFHEPTDFSRLNFIPSNFFTHLLHR